MRWKTDRQFLLGTVALLVIAGMLITYAIEKAFDGMCGNQLLSEVSSPDHVYRVVVFQRDCGATTGFSTQVSVLKAKETLPNESGTLFVADTDHGKAPGGIGGGPEVKISWVGSRSVRLTYHKNARVFFANPHFLEVSATYDSFK
jgi:Family of unknown function (DUF5412)